MEDVARYRDGVGVQAPRRRAERVPRPGRRRARRPARPLGADARPVPDARAGASLGAADQASSRMRSSGCSPRARSCAASSGRAAPSASGATPRCCACSAGGRWRGCGARSSRSIRQRSRGSCPPGTASPPVGEQPRPRSVARPPSSASRGRRPARRPRRSRRRSSSATSCPPASPATSRGCSTSSGSIGEVALGGAREPRPRRRPHRAVPPGRGGAPAGRRRPTETERPAGPRHDAIREHLARRGASFYREIFAAAGGGSDREVLDALWDLVWAGEVTNDTFAPLRALRWKRTGRDSRKRPGRLTALGPPEAAGRWSLVGTAPPRRPTERLHAQSAGPARAARRADPRGGRRRGDRRRVQRRLPGPARPRGGRPDPARLLRRRPRRRPVRAARARSIGCAPCASRRTRIRSRRTAHLLAAADPANPYGAALPWPRRGEDDRRPLQRAAGRVRRPGRRRGRRSTSSAAARRSRRCRAADDPGRRRRRRCAPWPCSSPTAGSASSSSTKIDGAARGRVPVPRRAPRGGLRARLPRPHAPRVRRAGNADPSLTAGRPDRARGRHALPDRRRAAAVPRRPDGDRGPDRRPGRRPADRAGRRQATIRCRRGAWARTS